MGDVFASRHLLEMPLHLCLHAEREGVVIVLLGDGQTATGIRKLGTFWRQLTWPEHIIGDIEEERSSSNLLLMCQYSYTFSVS